MARMSWNTAGSRFFEAGVDRGVLYVDVTAGVPWIGLISVDESPTGGDASPYYIDGIKYANLSTVEEFEATIKAYTYPVEFAVCDGTARVRSGLFFGQQRRKSFGFSYRTLVGNEINSTNLGYKIHIVYNALAAPSSRSASSFAESIDAADFSWSLTTQSRAVSGFSPTAHVVIDSRYTHPLTLAAIEDILYGSDSTVGRLPTPEELVSIIDVPFEFTVTDLGGGSFLIGGLDENVMDIGLGEFIIDHPGVVSIDADTYTVTS